MAYLWGAIAGYLGGRTDDSVMMRIVDVLYSLPTIIFVSVLVTTLGAIVKRTRVSIEAHPAHGRHGLRVVLLFVGLGAVSRG